MRFPGATYLLALCASETDAHAALEFAGQWMQAHGLGLHADKTRITQFKEGFSFLGVYFVDEQAYTPWKQKRATGRVIAMARPMPPPVLARYLAPAPDAPPFQRSLRRAARLLAGERDADFAAGDAEGRISVAFLYLTEQGSVLRKSGDRFLVEKDGTVLLDLPYHKLESVLIFGNVQITTQSLGELLEKGIGVSFLSRTGRFRGTLSSPQGKDIPLRMEQFRRFSDSAAALKLARTTIGAKIGNYVEVLRSYHEGAEAPEREGMEGLAARLTDAKELESLLGIEGSATRVYFEAVMKFNKSGMEWTGRARHPAPDPVNALLSLAYTLLASELTGVVEAHGLDNYLGYMHQMDYGRPSLALDLMEGFRGPVADRFVLTQINRRVFRAEEFQPHGESGGLRLTPEALVRFLEAWERWMLTPPVSRKDSGGVLPSFRRELRRDVERFVRHLRGESDWDGWRWDRVETAEEKACDTLSATT